MKLIRNVKIGADPEVFLINKYTGKFISAIGIIGGTKESPEYVGDGEFAIQVDNVCAEFNIPPANNLKDFKLNITKGLKYIEKALPYNLEILIKSSAFFEEDQLQSKLSKTFGCEPDFNIWTMKENIIASAEDSCFRTCGGHIHVGYDNPEDEEVLLNLAKALDLFLGVESVLLDKDEERRSLYGKAGSIRVKPYGLEYRTLSNFWISKDDLIEWAFTRVFNAVDFINAKKKLSAEDEILIQNCINNYDRDLAVHLSNKFIYKRKEAVLV